MFTELQSQLVADDNKFWMIYISILSIQFHPANHVIGDGAKVDETVRDSFHAAVRAFLYAKERVYICSAD